MTIRPKIINRHAFTKAENAVLVLLVKGKMRKEIARRLHRSYGTVSKQIESVAHKLDAHSAAEIISKCVAMNIIKINLKAIIIFFLMIGLTTHNDQSFSRTRTRLRLTETTREAMP